MNIITYGFFIYVCLTTIDGISAVQANISDPKSTDPKPECDLLNIIIHSEYTKTCEPSKHPDNEENYLCPAIYYTANRICQSIATSNTDVLPKNKTVFESEISKSLQHENYTAKFCNQLSEVITSPRYKLAISLGEVNRNVSNLNNKLPTVCSALCMFMKGLKMEVKPLCSVLSWMNRLLISLTVPTDPVDTPVTSSIRTSDKAEAKERQSENMVDFSHLQNPNNNPVSLPKTSNARGETTEANNIKPQSDSNVGSTLNSVKKKPVSVAESQESEILVTNVSRPGVPDTNVPHDSKGLSITNTSKIIDKSTSDTKPPTSNSPLLLDKTMEAPKPENVDTDHMYDEDGALDSNGIEDPNEILKDTSVQSNLPEPPETKDLNEKHLRYSPGDMNLAEDESHFFVYFMVLSLVCLMGWVGYHNKKKIMAIVLEGRKSRGGRGRRRPNTAGYRKLDCTLEEAVTSQCNSNVTHVIY